MVNGVYTFSIASIMVNKTMNFSLPFQNPGHATILDGHLTSGLNEGGGSNRTP